MQHIKLIILIKILDKIIKLNPIKGFFINAIIKVIKHINVGKVTKNKNTPKKK